MDAMATLRMPTIGYGIRYQFGIFRQEIRDGWQVEMSDEWLHSGNPWEIARPQNFHYVRFGGKVEPVTDGDGIQAHPLGTGPPDNSRGRLRHADSGLPGPVGEPARVVESGGIRIV